MDTDFTTILCIIIPMVCAAIFTTYFNQLKAKADTDPSEELNEINQLIVNGRKSEAIKKLIKERGISKKAATDLVISIERKLLSR